MKLTGFKDIIGVDIAEGDVLINKGGERFLVNEDKNNPQTFYLKSTIHTQYHSLNSGDHYLVGEKNDIEKMIQVLENFKVSYKLIDNGKTIRCEGGYGRVNGYPDSHVNFKFDEDNKFFLMEINL